MANIEKRTTLDNQTTYRVKVRLKGYPVQSATFERLTDARKWAQQTEAAIREGRHFKTNEARKHTLGDAIERYLLSVMPKKPKSKRSQTAQISWWREHLGAYSLADITPALIAQYRDKLAEGSVVNGKNVPRSAATINRYLAILSHVYTVAMNEWQWVQDNPLRKITKMKEPRGRVRFLSDDERTRLLDECRKSASPFLYLIVVLALSTGARKMELLSLKWNDVDLERGLIVLHETKNGHRRSLVLTGHALVLMKNHSKIRRLDSDLVFPGIKGEKPFDITSAWEWALKRADIKDFRFHDTRHSASSYLAMNGASLAEIAEVLGHKTLQMVKRYSHLSEAHTSKVVARMNEKIFG